MSKWPVASMTKQEIFDAVVEHLRKQNCKSKRFDGSCLYRYQSFNDKVLKCAAGIFIPEDKYSPNMENKGWPWIEENYPEAQTNSTHFIGRLQNIHDSWEVREWETVWEAIANEYGLKYTPAKAQ